MMVNRFMTDNSSPQEFPAYIEKSSRKSRAVIVLFIFLLILVGILVAGFYLFTVKRATVSRFLHSFPFQQSPTKIPPTPTTVPTPTPTPLIKKSDIVLAVLNGSGVSGAAQKVSTYLQAQGYQIKNSSNADSFAYTGITIVTMKTKTTIVSLLQKDLQSYQNTSSVSAKTLDTLPDGIDGEVIVGQ